ncbi:hypothetical protein ABZ897_58850 [Nonomuraea sp. NPDC046802]|uniref:hypothetical protein n=1 Tax=Nonomuraea sp. NPDC046802 TaxID=3154919 RepID=UPI0033E34B76
MRAKLPEIIRNEAGTLIQDLAGEAVTGALPDMAKLQEQLVRHAVIQDHLGT